MIGQCSGTSRQYRARDNNKSVAARAVGIARALTLHDGDLPRARPCCPAVAAYNSSWHANKVPCRPEYI